MEMETPPQPAPALEARSSFLEEKAFASRTVLVFGAINDSSAADTVHDVVRFISAPVRMIGTGWVGSAATHLFLSVPKERRFCLPQTRFLIHQPSGGAGGQATDIAIMAREIIKARERIAKVISRETGQPLEKVLVDIERDNWMGPQEAIEYGLISRVIESRSELEK